MLAVVKTTLKSKFLAFYLQEVLEVQEVVGVVIQEVHQGKEILYNKKTK